MFTWSRFVGWLQARLRFVRIVHAVALVQAAFRGHKARQYVKSIKQHRAALVIQSQWRRHVAQAAYQRYRSGVIKTQVRATGPRHRPQDGCALSAHPGLVVLWLSPACCACQPTLGWWCYG